MRSRRNEKGIALVIVLWGVTLLSLLAASFAQSSALAARRTLHAIEAAQARSRLDEALAVAVIALLRSEPRPWRADGQAHAVALPGVQAEIRVFAESGRIDLNHAPLPLLQSLFRQAAGDQEEGDRLAAALAARVTVRPLLAVAELAGMPGITASVYRRLADAVTVHNPGGKLDWRLAGKTALSALPGLSDSEIATLLAMRGQRGYTPDPALAEILAQGGAVADPAEDASSGGAKMVTMQIGVTLAGGASASAETLLQLTPGGTTPYRIVEWRAPAPLEPPS